MAKDEQKKSDEPKAEAPKAESAQPSAPAKPEGAPATAQVLSSVEPEALAAKKSSADPKFAGLYVVTHGSYKIGDKHHGEGSLLKLDAEDGARATEAGTALPCDDADHAQEVLAQARKERAARK